MKEIEMLATFNKEGLPNPFRFRITAEDESLNEMVFRHLKKDL